MDEFSYVVGDAPPGATVQGVLTHQLGASRALIRRLKASNGIFLNDRPVRVHQPARPGDVLRLVWPEGPSGRVDPEPVPLAIAYEDEDLILLDKPPGMVVHPTHGCHHGTLANGLAWYFQQQERSHGIHPVHRLDRQTSGLVLFAKHGYAHQQLALQLEAFKLDRVYLAVAQGLMPDDEGTIEGAIERLPGPGGFRRVAPAGQPAVTHFRVLARSAAFGETLLAVRLETGRTHQIRVHLAHSGHPLVGDAQYGQSHERLGHTALHAQSLTFRHPRTREIMRFSAPLPVDFQAHMERVFSGFSQNTIQA